MARGFSTVVAGLACGIALAAEPVKVIFDTDMLTDFDDVGALACLHALADAGECEILATLSCTRGNASVAAVEVINGYYGRPDLPVGCAKGMGVSGGGPNCDPQQPLAEGDHGKYVKLAKDYPQWVKHPNSDDAPDANDVYRRVLAAQPDGSVVICSVGFITNLRRLLETKGDAVSPLDGRALVAKKVRKWVAMACNYPSGFEYNSRCDPTSSRLAFETWPTPVVFSDFQLGWDVYAGRAIAETEGPRNPVKDVFAGNIPARAEVAADPHKYLQWAFGMGGRSAWDETAVLAAVRGEERYFNVHRGEYRMVGDKGEDVWVPDEANGRHVRLTEKLNKVDVGRVIDELICRGPRRSPSAGPVTILPGEGWTPLGSETGIRKDSALDFSGFGGKRVSAGSLGWTVARGSHFEFEKAPGVPQRFYGVNFCFTGNFMRADEAEELCTRLERIGYNAIRIHHYERTLCEGAKDGTAINPQRMAELDNLLNAAIRHGLYVTTDLYVSRQVPYRSCGIDREGVIPMHEFKELVLCHEGVRSNLVVFTKALLGHVNPATGRRWADEPALMSISLVNENNPGNHGFGFLRKTLGITAEQMPDVRLEELIAEKIAAFDREMIRVLKEEIGYRGLVTGLNGWHTPPCYRALRKAYDYVDDHFYVDHPLFLEKPWQLPSECRNANPLTYANPGIDWDKEAWVRHSDRPYTITEWNFSGPGRYRGAGGIVFGAGAALQEMDGVWRFAWSHSHDRLLKDGKLSYFDAATDPLMLATERAIIALYLRGDLPADRSVKKPTDPCRWLTADLTNGCFTIQTPRTAGVFAEPSARKYRMGPLSVSVKGHSAAVWATALDGRPLAKSRRLLVSHVTDVQDAGTVYRAADRKVLEKWGDLPHLMANGTAEIVLDTAQSLRVYALKADGMRLGEVKTQGRGLAFTADVARDPKTATYLYELVAE